jgi:RNA polymerase sigma factor (sigma-70 family)
MSAEITSTAPVLERPSSGDRPAEDDGLARLVGGGSERAFTRLYHRYHQPLYRYCRAMLRHDADAQDALQSTFVSAFTALQRGRRDAPLRPWLFRIAHNEAVNILRRRRPEAELPEELAAPAGFLEEQVEERERLAQLVGDLRELPERQRSALVLRELSGLSHQEIAQALETSVGTAKQTIFEARRSLAEFEEGRAMSCDAICRTLSDGDRRMLRSRRIRAHVRSCATCSAFAAAIPVRSAELRALTPGLAPAATGAMLTRALSGGASGGGGTGAVAAGTAGKAIFGVASAKLGAAIAVAVATATVGVSAVLSRPSEPLPLPHRSTPARMAVSGLGTAAGAGALGPARRRLAAPIEGPAATGQAAGPAAPAARARTGRGRSGSPGPKVRGHVRSTTASSWASRPAHGRGRSRSAPRRSGGNSFAAHVHARGQSGAGPVARARGRGRANARAHAEPTDSRARAGHAKARRHLAESREIGSK